MHLETHGKFPYFSPLYVHGSPFEVHLNVFFSNLPASRDYYQLYFCFQKP
jgi:hypothetical protein